MIKLLLSAFFLSISLSSNSQEKKETEQTPNIFDKMIEWDNKLKSLKANFNQEVIFKVAEMKQSVEGNIVFEKPDNIKITHAKPQKQIIIINSQKDITIIKPQDRQIIKSSWEKWKANLEPKLKGLFDLGNYSSLGKNSKIEFPDSFTIKITPKDSSYILTLKLNEKYFPIECELDLKDTVIKTYLKDINIDSKIEKDEFEYKNKEKYEVLKL
ncbi:MAG: outer-membrane lipoprotein carrier protein LolA [Elusimicrobiales bacterium]|jgi:outer membrane lipoprotein-sorting protein|nr:outer-membrane lipoprotein carrier protein LolA [Elusimicrobiales bacterium]HOJ86441.1 outer-membrane lipoprotein carrier protein LolA [Elusimicrobiales bacterium]HOL62885.1 outer-membrane lipoprotein carrier protein LolA [Elusimicrobiales bacterium]HPO94999.1 outer-membrane lipoprotein carrier protein LolA [Elusimicrobiales bacterium]